MYWVAIQFYSGLTENFYVDGEGKAIIENLVRTKANTQIEFPNGMLWLDGARVELTFFHYQMTPVSDCIQMQLAKYHFSPDTCISQ